MKITMYALFFMIILNTSVVILKGAGIEQTPLTPITGDYDVNGTWQSYDAEDSEFYDTGSGFLYMQTFFLPFIEAFPEQLSNMGTPTFMLTPLRVLWNIIWIGWGISFFSGRDFMP